MVKLSLKQLGSDITSYVDGLAFILDTEVPDYKKDANIADSKVTLYDGSALSNLQKKTLKTLFIKNTNLDLVGIAYIKNYNETNKQYKIRAIKYGSGDGNFCIYKSNKDLDTDITKVTSLNLTDIDGTGLTIGDFGVDQLVYDKAGTVGKITTINKTTNVITVTTITDATYMPIAPNTKQLVVNNGGSGYQVNDIIESTDTGVFAKVINVDASGIILEVESTTSTTQNVHGTGAIIDNEQVIYGAYEKNWAALSKAAVQVAQVLAEKFTYETGYSFEITNGGTGFAVGDIVSTDNSNVFVKVTKVNSGVIEEVEYSREKTATKTNAHTIIATPDTNVFITPDDVWNEGITLLSLTNDDGASVQFFRTDDSLVKNAVGSDSKLYKFVFNPINGTITQSYSKLSGEGSSIKDYTAYAIGDEIKKDDLIIEDAKLFRAKSTYTNTGVWNDDKVKFEEISEGNAGTLLNSFQANYQYEKNEMILVGNTIYRRRIAGISGSGFNADISNWELCTELHGSHGRYVVTNVLSQPITNVYNTIKSSYKSGDNSLYNDTDSTYTAPVDGLYYLRIGTLSVTNGGGRYDIVVYKNGDSDSNVIAYTSEPTMNNSALSIIQHLKAGDVIIPKYYSTVNTTIDVSTLKSEMEFGLIAEDQSDGLICSAQYEPITSLTDINERSHKLINISDTSIMDENFNITLPEDGSYIICGDMVLSSTGGTSANAIIYVKDKNNKCLATYVQEDTISTIIPSFSHIISGLKGDKFKVTTKKPVVQSNLTESVGYVRLFKVKSTNTTITPDDLYNTYKEHQTNPLNYDEWVKQIVQRNEYHITAKTIATACATSDATQIKSIYYNGMSSMLNNNRFIAPIAGLYNIHWYPVKLETSVAKITSIITKNENCFTSWATSNVTAMDEQVDTSSINGCSCTLWLDKDEYISPSIWHNGTMTYPAGVFIEFSLLQGGTGLENYPNKWPENVEINLGNGLYGYRATGVITAAANYRNITRFLTITSNLSNPFISQGGSWIRDNSNVSISLGGSDNNGYYSNINYNGANGNISLITTSTNVRTDASYDVWIKYTK